MFSQLLLFSSAFVFSLLLTYPVLFLRAGQSIREEGPASHQAKSGTPTMGGIGFVLTIIIFSLIFIDFDLFPRYLALVLMFLGFSFLGFADDFVKVSKHRNLGLTFWQKIILQTLFAGAFSYLLVALGHSYTVSGWLWAFGFANPLLYFLLSTFIIVGTANAANLTDGLDGLLAGCAVTAFVVFAVLANGNVFANSFCLIVSGAVLGFLFYNFPKAKLFMGDVGSLPLGAALAGIGIILHKELLLVLVGLIFVLEALSVIIQVASYKLFKKRVFKMTPLHHHFELMGWPEGRVVVVFWVVALFVGLAALIIT